MAYTDIDKPSDYFETKLYTGTGTTLSVGGLSFKPDWVWLKARSNAYGHAVYDNVRGATKYLYLNLTNAEATNATTLQSFDTDGFTLGANENTNQASGITAVSWNWLGANTTVSNTAGTISSTVSANTTSGFSIVSYTGTGSNATVGHGLGVAPKMIIAKVRSGADNWMVGHDGIGWTHRMQLNLTNAAGALTAAWNNTAPTSSVFTVGTNGTVNGNGSTYIAYCFAEKQGYSKFGSYTGNGSTDGTFVYTGFKPAFVIYKNASAIYHWGMYDNKREPFNVCEDLLFPNLSNAESTGDGRKIDMLSNGFKVRATSDINNINGSGNTMIYMAIAENPFVTSTGVPATAR
jgi:hypothetical protein